MGNFTKNQLKREIMKLNVKQVQQTTLDNLSYQFNTTRSKEAIKQTKKIVINRISDSTKEDELSLKVEFSLLPSKTWFSKVNLDLFFQEHLLNSTTIGIP